MSVGQASLDAVVNPDADGLVGGLTIWPSDALPSAKYMFAEGQEVSRETYSLLFSRYGTLHGVGDGSTTFNLPDMIDMFPLGGDGDTVATGTVTATGSPTNTGAGTSHSHGAGSYSVSALGAATAGPTYPTFDGMSGSKPVTGTSGSESSHTHPIGTITPPNVRLRYIVKVA